MIAPYYALKGTFTTAQTSPDGDTLRFVPDKPEHLAALATTSPPPPQPRASARVPITLRLEGIDAPELHYAGTRQRRAATARSQLLHRLNLRNWSLTGDRITTTKQSRGWIIARQLDIYGRVIGFAYRATDLPLQADTPITLDRKTLLASANATMLATGAAYHLAYSTLEKPLRQELQALATTARRARRGLWSSDSTPAFPFRGLGSICERGALVLPKLFRRCVAFCRESASKIAAADFVRWLQKSPGQDDWVEVGGRRLRLSALLSSGRDRVRVEVDPMGIVFIPRG